MATTTTPSMTALSDADAQALQARLRGPLLLPGAPGYDAARAVWNAMIDRRPAAIARCLGTADVIACVDAARALGLPLCLKGGGHNIAGLAVADGALMLDFGLMRGVWTQPAERVAHVQPGALLGDVDRDTQLHGLAAVLGFVSNTGVAGLTLGGGFGYLSRRFGWTCENVRAFELVTADGRRVRASADEHPELFWALRGGGGNFGVVTRIEYLLQPVGPEIVGGAMAWRADAAPRVLAWVREAMAGAPPERVYVPLLRMAPPAPWLPAEVHGRPVIMVVVCDTGPLDAAERAVAPLRAIGTPVGDVVQRRPYVTQQSLIDATQPAGRRYYWKSEYLPALDPALLEAVPALAARIPSPHSALVLFPVDGPHGDVAAGNADARWVLNITSAWERAEDDAPNLAWARDTWQDLRRFSTGGVYVNFLTAEEGEARIHAAYGANYERLAHVKAAWDPDNVFRANKNIAPAPRGD